MEETKGGPTVNEPGNLTPGRLFEAIKDLSYAKSSDDLLDRLLKKISSLFSPEMASFLLKDLATGGLRYALVAGEQAEVIKDRFIAKGEGLPGLAAETNQNIIITDPTRDPRFNTTVDQIPGLEIRCLIAIPFHVEKRVQGLVYLINRKSGPAFNLEEFRAIQTLVAFSELLLTKMVLWKQVGDLEDLDQLTGAFNLKSFFNYFKREVARCERYGTDLSLLQVSIDYYEKIIQTFGQEAGERVLLNLSFILKKTTRKVDLVARNAEHEFLVMLPQTNQAGAQKVRERIQKILKNQNLRATGIPFTVTITVYSESGEQAVNLYKIPEINAGLNNFNQKRQKRKYPTIGEELEEAARAALFPWPK